MALNISTKTRQSLSKATAQVLDYFCNQNGLDPLEIRAHLHGREGYVDVAVSGRRLVGAEEYEPQEALASMAENMVDKFGLRLQHYSLHMHAANDPIQGFVQITCTATSPVEIHAQTDHLEDLTRLFFQEISGRGDTGSSQSENGVEYNVGPV